MPFLKDSQDMTEKDREIILDLCVKTKYSKIIITHGTDTMIETAQYIGSIQQKDKVENLSKKRIVLTGAMKPQRFENTDAHFNVGLAMGVVSCSLPGTTLVCMNGASRSWDAVRRCLKTGKFVAK